jgi:hypothetical protein
MVERIIPGTYISVRAEGLIAAGGVATGVVGVVGTASRGPVNEPVTLAGFANARDIFGLPDDFRQPEDGATPLTLVRALQHVYGNGAGSVVAVRVTGATATQATYAVQDTDGHTVAMLTATTPGTWGNDIRIEVEEAEEDCRIDGETQTTSFDRLNYAPVVPSAENRIRVTRGITRRVETPNLVYKQVYRDEEVRPTTAGAFILAHGPVEEVPGVNEVRVLSATGQLVRRYGDDDILYGAGAPPGANELRINPSTRELTFEATQVPSAGQQVLATYGAGHADPTPGQLLVTTWDGSLDFATGEAPQPADGDTLSASYVVDRSQCAQVTLRSGVVAERFTAPDGEQLSLAINRSSTLVSGEPDETHGGALPRRDIDAYFGSGTNTPGSNGADAGADEHAAGLERLLNETINIVVLAGQDAETMGAVLVGHLSTTAQTDHERIGVIGARGATVAEFLGHSMASDRVILVAPGIVYPDGTTLPPAYTAAAVAGLISSLPVQGSLTNKALNLPGLALDANRGQQSQLIQRNVLAVIRKEGFRVLKGITTEGTGMPFSAIPTRRIVDFAKYGVRSAANPYLGRLNNERVRAAMKATLDAFLTRMVQDEALTGYILDVSATRAQEIAGEVSVTMTLQPTFSIDFIVVTMNLQ